MMQVKTNVKAGGRSIQHNQMSGVKVRSQVKAGGRSVQHNQTRAI